MASLPAAAGASAGRRAVLVRVCEGLDGPAIVETLAGYVPDARFVLDGDAAGVSAWIDDACFDGDVVGSSLTDTETGAQEAGSWPMPLDVLGRATDRFAAHVLGEQVRTMLDLRRSDSESDLPESPPPPPGGGEGAERRVETPMTLNLYLSVACDAVGGLSPRTDGSTVALGPGFRLGVILGENGIVGIGVRSLSFVGTAAEFDVVDALPVLIEGGWAAPLGPVEIQALLQLFAERWSPSGASWAGDWRGGLGAAGALVVPILGVVAFRVDFGVEYFTEGYTLRYTTEMSGETVAVLANWRWRAAAGFEFRIALL